MTSLPQRQLGADGPAVSAVGLGCMSISWGYYLDPQDEAVSERTLQRAVELGVTHFDTASLYGRGHNETLVGRALRDRPRRGADRVQVRARESRLPAAQDGARRPARDDPATVRGLAGAARHRRARPLLPAPRRSRRPGRGELRHALRARRARARSAASASRSARVDELARAHATHPVSALQSEFSLWTRGPLEDVIPWCAANGVSFVAFGVLGRGFLTGALTPGQTFPRATSAPRTRASSPRRWPPTSRSSTGCGASPRASAPRRRRSRVAWVLAQGEHVLPIPGTKREHYLEEDLGGGRRPGRRRRSPSSTRCRRPSAPATPEPRFG